MSKPSDDNLKLSLSLKDKTKNTFNQLLSLGQVKKPLAQKQSVLCEEENDETVLITQGQGQGQESITTNSSNKKQLTSEKKDEPIPLKETAVKDKNKLKKKKSKDRHSERNSDIRSNNKVTKDKTEISDTVIQSVELETLNSNASYELAEDASHIKKIEQKNDDTLKNSPFVTNKEKKIQIIESDQLDPQKSKDEKLLNKLQKGEIQSKLNTTVSEDVKNVNESLAFKTCGVSQSPQIPSTSKTLVTPNKESVLAVLVHDCDSVHISSLMNQPVVKIHLIDEKSGNYIKKSSKERHVTSFYETGDVEYILPIITKPFNVRKQTINIMPMWEELIIFNENYDYLLNESVIIFFEILDFSVNSNRTHSNNSYKGWKNIAWAFLKLKGANDILNTEKKLRLQLYKYKSKAHLMGNGDIYQIWKSRSKSTRKACIRVTIKSIIPPLDMPCGMRSLYPIQQEKGNMDILKTIAEKNSESVKKISNQPIWMRLPSQPCRIPKKLDMTVKPSNKGCLVVKFSCNGKLLACGCCGDLGYRIVLYSIPDGVLKVEFCGHMSLIYDLNWSKDDKHLVSASADCTVQVWDTKNFSKVPLAILPHPSFVYCVNFHSVVQTVIVSGCHDSVIRLWSIKQLNIPHNGTLVQELEGHKSHVNSLCFEDEGNKLYSADGVGAVIIWNAYFTEQPSKMGVSRDWSMYKIINEVELKGLCISHILMHPKSPKLLIHTRNNSIKMYDLRSSSITVRFEGFVNYQELIRCCVSPCGSFVFSGSEDGSVSVWNCDMGDQVTKYTDLPYRNAVTSVCFHPHDNILALCSNEKNSPVLIYSYDYNWNESSINQNMSGTNASQLEDFDNKYDTLLTSAKKHVSFDIDIEKSIRVQKAIKKMDSVLESSINSSNETTSCQNSSIQAKSLAIPLITERSPSPKLVSPLSFTLPALAAEFQKQLMNQNRRLGTQSGNINASVKISLSGKARSPSFKFQVPSIKKDEHLQLVKSLYSYNAARSDELSFNAGESIKVLYKDSDTWWMGEKESSGEQGFFPVNYVKQNFDH